MSDFLKFVDELRQREPIHVEIYYSEVLDWIIRIIKKGRPGDGGKQSTAQAAGARGQES